MADDTTAHAADEPSSPDGGPAAASSGSDRRPAEFDDLISRLREIRPDLRPAEQRVADVVLDDVEFAVRASNTRLAEMAGVSEPTVTRFCRALGCDGVRDFKLRLAQSLVVGKSYFREPPQVSDSASLPYWRSVFHNAGHAIRLAEQQLDETAVAAAVDILAGARRILVFGTGGGSTALAQDTQYRLFRYGLSVTAYSDALLMRMVAATLGPEDAVIALSATGRSTEVLDAVRLAGHYHTKVVAITGPDTALSAAVDVALTLSVPEIDDIMKPTASRFAFLVTIDLLATGIAYRLGLGAQETLRRIKYNLMNLREGEILEPLGD